MPILGATWGYTKYCRRELSWYITCTSQWSLSGLHSGKKERLHLHYLDYQPCKASTAIDKFCVSVHASRNSSSLGPLTRGRYSKLPINVPVLLQPLHRQISGPAYLDWGTDDPQWSLSSGTRVWPLITLCQLFSLLDNLISLGMCMRWQIQDPLPHQHGHLVQMLADRDLVVIDLVQAIYHLDHEFQDAVHGHQISVEPNQFAKKSRAFFERFLSWL